MNEFTKILVVSPLANGKSWYLREEFSYDVGSEGSGDTIKVPVGFVTDFASVPRPLWWLFPRWGKYGNGAVIHDYLYWDRGRSKRESDDIFLEAMIVLKVGWFTRTMLHQVLRWFGWSSWWGSARSKRAGRIRVASLTPKKSVETPRELGL